MTKAEVTTNPEVKYSRCGKKVKVNNHVIYVSAYNLLLKGERLLAIKNQITKGKMFLGEATTLINNVNDYITE